MATKEEAIERLAAAGHDAEAREVERWRAENGTIQGWDGWFKGAYPELHDVVWPEGTERK